MENIKNKQIITLVGIVFLAFVGYKIISSNIQENKEKAILRERAQLQELEKEPLNRCIDNINDEATNEIKQMEDLARDVRSPETYSSCMQPTGHGSARDALIASGEINLKDYCTFTFEEQAIEKKKILDNAKIEIEECYKRYK